VGLRVDDDAAVLWACTVDFTFVGPSTVTTFDLATGDELDVYPLGAGAFCNDLTMDAGGNVYATDTAGSVIYRLAPGADAIEPWSSDAAFPGAPGDFTVNGIAWDGDAALYTVKYASGELFRVPIQEDGSAGAAEPITLDHPLALGDGLQALDAETLIVVQGTGSLTRIDVSGAAGTTTTLGNRLDSPTTFAIVGDAAWVVEGQLDHLLGFDPAPPFVPFLVRRVPLH
jgi:sugar lactone lactonase YvrE